MGWLEDRLGDRLRAVARPWEVAVFVWVPAIGLAFTCWYEAHAARPLEDFAIFRKAAKTVLHGDSPFPAANVHAVEHFNSFVYPRATALLFAPFAALPTWPARIVMLALGWSTVLVALRLLGVTDWRCYGLSLIAAPTINSVALGAVTTFLLLGAAATWRYRSRPGVAGSLAALTAVFKVLLWPLAVWLLITRRIRALAVFVVAALVAVLGGWAVIGFADFSTYPKLLHALSQAEQLVSYSPVALFKLSGTAATALSLASVLVVVGAVALCSRGKDGDRRGFAVAVIGSLVATPILWEHYLLLLLVPIGLYRPRLSALWFVPFLLWATPATHSHGDTWRIIVVLVAIAVVTVGTVGEDAVRNVMSRVPAPRIRSVRRFRGALNVE